MNGNSLLLDTNTVLYVLAGDLTLAKFLQNKSLYLSIISELELLSFKKLSKIEVSNIRAFLDEMMIINITDEIKRETIALRKTSNLKLPDCIIAATAITLNIPMISSDKQLKSINELDLVYYEK